MRALLHSAQLGPQYWSWALLHAMYHKNRLPHRAITITPFKAYPGNRPHLKHLRIFGSPVAVRNPGRRPAKLDTQAMVGIFLGYTATTNNIYYLDSHSNKSKIITHVIFNEAGYTIPPRERTHPQQCLQHQHTPPTTTKNAIDNLSTPMDRICSMDQVNTLQVAKLTENAPLPKRSTEDAGGYDIYSAATITLAPHTTTKIPTDIAIHPPPGMYCQILSRSGMVANHGIETKAGTMDRDYHGNVMVLLHNNNSDPYTVTKGDRIAQMIVYPIQHLTIKETAIILPTAHRQNGFGSTGYNDTEQTQQQDLVITQISDNPATQSIPDTTTISETIAASSPTNDNNMSNTEGNDADENNLQFVAIPYINLWMYTFQPQALIHHWE